MDNFNIFQINVAGRDFSLIRANELVAVRFSEALPTEYRARIAGERMKTSIPQNRYEVPNEKFTIYPIPRIHDTLLRPLSSVIDQLNSSNEVVRSTPVFRFRDKWAITTDRILVKLKSGSQDISAEFQKMGITILERKDGELTLGLPPTSDPLDIANTLSNLGVFEYVEPDFVVIGNNPERKQLPGPLSSELRDYFYNITHVSEAWAKNPGNPAIKIAILDDGIDINHPLLSGSIKGIYDAISDSNIADINPWDSHGTACAGLAAALNESTPNFRGVGAGCSLLMVRVAQTAYQQGPWSTSNSIISRGIDWATQNGASILSNSWGGGVPSNAVINALERARVNGRSGKGCVVVVAAGNDSNPVDFPGNVAGVLTVAGTNEFDEFKTPYTRDGEDWWGSNYGSEVDIAAPSVHIRTTDIVGQSGRSAGDFVTNFNGTSAATPIVAGAAALLLSLQPDLTESIVRQILKDSADKVGQYQYSSGRNDYLGYGRLNVDRAIRMVNSAGGAGAVVGGGVAGSEGETPAITDQFLIGTVQQAGDGSPRAGGFYLDQDGNASYLLKVYPENAMQPLSLLEEQNLTQLSQFADRRVKVRYTSLQNSIIGAILWGCDLQLAEDGLPVRSNGNGVPCVPKPHEVCLGPMEE